MKLKDIVKGKVYVMTHPKGNPSPYRVKEIITIPTEYRFSGGKPMGKRKVVYQCVNLVDGSQRGATRGIEFICEHTPNG